MRNKDAIQENSHNELMLHLKLNSIFYLSLIPINLSRCSFYVFLFHCSLLAVISSFIHLSYILSHTVHSYFNRSSSFSPFLYIYVHYSCISSLIITCPYKLKRFSFTFSVTGASFRLFDFCFTVL